ELFILKVSRKNLKPGTRLSKVGFTDCTTRTRFLFSTDDSRLVVETEGIITVKRQVVLHEGNQNFSIHAWDSQGQKMTLPVRLLYQDHHYMNNRLDAEYHHEAHKLKKMHLTWLKRRKRGWVIPPINVPEHSRGPFPLFLVVIRSDEDKVKTIYYSITGPGADQPPVGLFTMNRDTGHLHVTQELDREKVDKYTVTHSVAEGGDGKAEEPMEIIIKVIDQNDNKPVFSQSVYVGEVPEASQEGFQVIQVVATDADEPNTDNSDIRYHVMSQKPEEPSPNMFTINPTTGVIRVNEAGLDREKIPQYTLEVQAADNKGEGLTGFTKVIIKVTDLNDHTPIFIEPFVKKHVSKSEDLAVNSTVVRYTATDPDTGRKQKVMYEIISDPAGWFDIDKETGEIKVRNQMDRESPLVKEDKYSALIGAYDDDQIPATATGTLVLHLQDVNDSPPTIEERKFTVCSKIPVPQLLTVTDRDGPGFTSPYNVSLVGSAKANWTARMISTRTGIILTLNRELEIGDYTVAMSIADSQGLSQVSTVTARVCDCTGEDVSCREKDVGGSNSPVILGILKAIVVLLISGSDSQDPEYEYLAEGEPLSETV
uniref:Cadherin domain-containing protein n=1 Tax=Xiphophorus couchianus TaxID=32473 RepID=A0A3B5MH88_9TELE